MKNWYFFLFFVLLIIPLTNSVFGETIKIQIPAGSSAPLAKVHFLPQEVSARVGDKVQWGNADSAFHTVTSGTLSSGPSGFFDSGHLNPGGIFEVLFKESDLGEIKYFCTIHPWMIGIVNVIDLERGFKVYHNAGSEVSESPIDIPYKVQRNLGSIIVEPDKKNIIFNFEGRVNNDVFVAKLSKDLISSVQSVWRDDKQATDYELKELDGIITLTVPLMEETEQLKLTGTEVIGKHVQREQILINQIFAITDKNFYQRGDEIVISGEIQNPVQLDKVFVDVSSPGGQGVYHNEIQLINASRFTETIPTAGILLEFGEYSAKITAPSAKSSFMKFEYGLAPKETISPLKQVKAGFEPEEVVCKTGYVLMSSPTAGIGCFKEESTQKLEMRNWQFTNTIQSKIITQEDDQKSVSLKPTQRFLLNLSDFYDWKIEIDDISIVHQSQNFRSQKSIQGIYEAQNSGQTSLRATGDPFCLKLEPACRVASILFTLQIVVSENTNQEPMQIANPASVYCEENGGMLEIRDSKSGQQGICVFSNGKECDEWEYFRGECNP